MTVTDVLPSVYASRRKEQDRSKTQRQRPLLSSAQAGWPASRLVRGLWPDRILQRSLGPGISSRNHVQGSGSTTRDLQGQMQHHRLPRSKYDCQGLIDMTRPKRDLHVRPAASRKLKKAIIELQSTSKLTRRRRKRYQLGANGDAYQNRAMHVRTISPARIFLRKCSAAALLSCHWFGCAKRRAKTYVALV